eukprot:jgi/Hompol1/5479/HPOL_000918-RA
MRFITNLVKHGPIHAWIDVQAVIAYDSGMRIPPPDPWQTIDLPTVIELHPACDNEPRRLDADFPAAVIMPCLCATLEDLEDLAASIASISKYQLNVFVCIDGPSPYQPDIVTLLKGKATVLFSSIRRGAAFARNRCLERVATDCPNVKRVCMLDSGMTITTEWWQSLCGIIAADPDSTKSNQSSPQHRNVIYSGLTLASRYDSTGRTTTPTFLSSAYQSYLETAGVLNARKLQNTQNIVFAPTCNLIIPASALQIKFVEDYFPDAGFEDVEYSIRCHKIYKLPIRFLPDLKAYHRFRAYTIADIERRFKRYGRNVYVEDNTLAIVHVQSLRYLLEMNSLGYLFN